jgi:hypothetical protein
MMAGGIRFGQRPRVGLVLARAIAVERQFVEKMRSRRCSVPFVFGIVVEKGEGAVVVRHRGCLSAGGSAALVAAFTAITRPAPNRGRTLCAAATRRMADAEHFASRCKAGPAPAAENGRRPPLRARAGSGRSPLGKAGARFPYPPAWAPAVTTGSRRSSFRHETGRQFT